MKSGNADGAKGGREANASSEGQGETSPARVPPEADKPVGEDLWECHKAERVVWSEKMLMALERGVKGGRWYSLMDKVTAGPTLSRGVGGKGESTPGGGGVSTFFDLAFFRRILVLFWGGVSTGSGRVLGRSFSS